MLQVEILLDTPQGRVFVLVVIMDDNPRSHEAFRIWLKGVPAGDNVILVDRDKIEIGIHGNTMVTAWIVPIPLMGSYVVSPACIIIEGYCNLKTSFYIMTLPTGYKFDSSSNGFDAFVTFIHSKSKYSGPGTDGYLARDEIMDIALPR